MNLKTQNAKNIISKDETSAKTAAFNIVNNCDVESFKTLCDNSDVIFDFLAQKAVNRLVCVTNEENLKNTFEFAKIYNPVFERYILSCWLKFANEDLTDSILELFENGSDEQKIYAAKYFSHINDPLAKEFLNRYAFCDNEDLSRACAATLRAFGDIEAREKALGFLTCDDEFNKYKALKFLINYSDVNDLKLVVNSLSGCIFPSAAAQDILYKYTYDELAAVISTDEIFKLYDEIISAYPEDISLDTVYDLDIIGFAVKVKRSDNSYAKRILADLKLVCELINSDNIYTYDLSAQHLKAVRELADTLDGLEIEPELVSKELFCGDKRALKAINTLINLRDKSAAGKILELYSQTDNSALLCECARAAKSLDIKLDSASGLEKIKDENAKELFKSYFG